MDSNNGFDSSFFVSFPNNPNFDVSEYIFFLWLPLSAKAVSIYRLTGSRELKVTDCYTLSNIHIHYLFITF